MIKIEIRVSTNASAEEKARLCIPQEAMEEFLGEGFASNDYNGCILFQCMPRAVTPSFMDVTINLKDIGEGIIAWATIVSCLVKFFKKCKGYEQAIHIDYKKNDEEFSIDVPVENGCDEEKLLKEIKKIVKELK